ncbi:hypothetical protein EO98_18500 [Methanosarcina sp. 2.H.T.1A.6]|uniref:hypothetical protein n=1 Tax=unclassified Methanosarcina TaxID=2644672 RepID=UPI00062223A4|nr:MULTISPECIES: hypothetical protein [unclassified Methanosarcina]KKG14621.1 hypothetical protein EO97_03815 [Methanosarcina sp. 2.H.T.1A.15]KKG17056.1 hypothetical protein EO94_18395 [Methanosarcina sp. 2.H.T.1A.3]KKG20321.1 hypothetical protein EO98_18500 [Methanosarcina sp. 2.H.T.1A.6]KKG23415.1 hypothetical protein EO96_17360 [Methanosarcina sp. 2.H.T.1A.8]
METGWFVTANDIKQWTETNKRQAEGLLPELVRRLILASCKPDHLHFPSGDSIAIGGWDGTLEVDEGNEFVPSGFSVWEFGTNGSINNKFESDYQKRSDDPGDISLSETAFVFVTSRIWKDKDKKCSEKNKENVWEQVRGINADDLENWLQQCPSVHRWFASLIGKRTGAIWDIEQAWESWACGTSIKATFELVLNGRSEQSEHLLNKLTGSSLLISVKADSENEAYAFTLATIVKNEDLAPRALIVKDRISWNFLLETQNSLIFVPQGFTPENIGYAKQKGHFVVIPVDSSSPRMTSNEINLGKMLRDDRIIALQSMGISKDQAEKIYSDTRGFMGPIRRHGILGPHECMIPKWVDHFDPKVLVAILMMTKWDTRKSKDKEAISILADTPYDQLESKLYELTSFEDTPVRLIGSYWQVISKNDLWSLIARKINRQSIDRLENVVFDVLGESDPSFDLPPEDRWLGSIKNAVPEYSEELKFGLADTLALFSAFGDDECQNMGEIKLTDQVTYWVRELLTKDISARGWYSIGRNLVPLAEAAPDSFLKSLESSMEGSDPSIGPLFIEQGVFCGCPYSNLQWALETISWNLNYLPRVSLSLARLSEIYPGERHSNGPLNSLKEIYLGWINNTSATHENRLQIIDTVLIKYYPEVTWKLLISLLPEDHGGFSSSINKPNYHNWAETLKKGVINKDYYQYVNCVADKLIDLVDHDPKTRWLELVKNVTRLPKKSFYTFIDKLLTVKSNELDDNVKLEIANELRSIISRHKEFKGREWALPEEATCKLEEAFDYIVPDDLILKNKYLFDEYTPEFINPIIRLKTNHQDHEEIIENYRKDALLKIYQMKEIDGIKKLTRECNFPTIVGTVIAKSEFKSKIESELLNWLESDEENLIIASQSFIFWCAIVDESWVNLVSNQCSYRNKDWIVNFLLGLPFGKNTFEILNRMDKEITEAYWKKVNRYYLRENDMEMINWVADQLLINERPLNALDATHVFYGSSHDVSLDCSLLVSILKKTAFTSYSNSEKSTIKTELISAVQTQDYNILSAIEYIQEQGQLSREEVALIEWIYLPLLKYNSLKSVKPLYLEKEILSNPEFFVQTLSLVFKPNNEGDLTATSKKIRAENAWLLLSMISEIPGQQENSISAEKLREWIYKARNKLEKLDILKIGDSQIGTILSNSPVGTDGIWPHEVVRDLIEELRNPALEHALEIGKWNSRGATTRLPFDGGKQERDLAKEYHDYAEKLALQWPRTSEVLRSLERSYGRHADKEDWDVELLE